MYVDGEDDERVVDRDQFIRRTVDLGFGDVAGGDRAVHHDQDLGFLVLTVVDLDGGAVVVFNVELFEFLEDGDDRLPQRAVMVDFRNEVPDGDQCSGVVVELLWPNFFRIIHCPLGSGVDDALEQGDSHGSLLSFRVQIGPLKVQA
ncbi:hypothetical protein A2223_02810 [Candidatus Falkowbacteria bacterium RIFOXYA2_FULL_35_8]|uniref:Uncharacterized protein n=1 Tax=Candidatus Falkowbacteria bacterium RIFOXYC2_FULL_36_12 TaxID=1798002 RepID=A0A1F5SW98_9BACT|nr:MAG: hypothetical protein A2478_01010 [Candidatus Falkowbacteria bacterium RIFOXYC2_FULL_36_12]OGF34432.1 MAG: hypothetical protein A2223_02810 [Candidatus Falkowbacteria bacterium RIFOXYA2_FULL_35_8]